eukprot:gene26609-biopygen4190
MLVVWGEPTQLPHTTEHLTSTSRVGVFIPQPTATTVKSLSSEMLNQEITHTPFTSISVFLARFQSPYRNTTAVAIAVEIKIMKVSNGTPGTWFDISLAELM